ncbi:lysophospholipid acyltransferase family protein [Aquirufa rosea]|uniref:Lipid A biosynthesis acyltransferase n=1 Tax=Aquirufa rosea TaxID=2509241 RepID=A0A4Q1C1U6_9BACT|nr:lysophospholipid acyltransferase family protein [Aquirufa rosea]RXK52170.1 lipid A biosynthesis acyltransferase [Aquirufa rosea]
MMFFFKLLGSLPLFVLYGIANCLKWIFYAVISYRKKVIKENLQRSFPEKSAKEINEIAFKFYGYLTDQLVEFFKGVSLSEKQVLDHVELKNPEIVQIYLDQGIPVIMVAGHQGNWEWAIHRLALTKNTYDIVYQKLNNPAFNQFSMEVRQKFGHIVLMEKRESVILTRDRKLVPRGICLAADQAPQKPESAYWTNFLNQDTAFFTGMERFAREYQYPVVFAELLRKGRGQYSMTYEILAEPSFANLPHGEIIERFARRLEKSIIENPEQYLWSHRRWKHKKPAKISTKWN